MVKWTGLSIVTNKVSDHQSSGFQKSHLVFEQGFQCVKKQSEEHSFQSFF